VACTALFLAGSAQAVHEFTLQLDGDVSTQAYTVQNPANQVDDWGANTCNVAEHPVPPGPACATGIAGQTDTAHSIFLASRNAAGTTESVAANPATVGASKAFDSANFQRDFESGAGCTLNSTSATRCSADDTTYSTGSKDTLGIANGGWQCGHSQNVNNKVDINNAYIASFWTGGSAGNGDHILYAGVEKEKNNGTNDIGVWFLQGSASCSQPSGPNINWSGTGHRNGDVLVVSEFSNGGGVSTVKTFTWRASTDPTSKFFGDGGCIDSRPGHFHSDVSGDCNQLQSGGGGDCKSAGPTDTTCATTNALATTGGAASPYKGTVSTPWLASDATLGIGNNQVVAPDFIEMGIDITALFAGTGETAPSCFSTGIPDTRSSPSVTATLFDYTVNTIGGCGSRIETHPQDSTPANITSDLSIGANAAVQVRDHADITVTGFTGSFGGTVTFYLCGPLALDSTSNCNDTDTAGPPAVVDTHGVQIGSPVTVSGSNGAASVNSSDSSGVNGNTVLTSVGRYCWRAVYSGNGDVPGSVDPAKTSTSTSECFKVQPLKATLSTAASCTKTNGTDCVINVDTLSDTATVGNTAKQPGSNGIGAATAFSGAGTIDATNQAAADNSITWTLKFGASCTAVGRFGTNGSTARAVSGNGTYPTASQSAVSYSPSTSATPADGVGLYTFVAAYPGNGPNTTAADSTACPDTGHTEEITVIGTATSSSKQGWLPNDRITLGSTAGTTLKGTLTVTLYYGAMTASSTLANCAATPDTITSGNKFSQQFSIDRTGLTPSNSDTEFTTNSTHYVGTNPSTGAAGDLPDTDASHSYFWLIHYDDNSLTDPPDRCETATITHNDG